MEAVISREMREIDRIAIEEYKIPGIVLMENAARSAYDIISKELEIKDKILVVCGCGNNGGDGFAIARMLKHDGFFVSVVIIGESQIIKGDAKINLDIIKNLNINIVEINSDKGYNKFKEVIENKDIIIDAILGTGCSRVLDGYMKRVVEDINEANVKVFAIDVPTGINADNGQVMGICVKAYKTITFCLPKVGLYLLEGAAYTGEVIVTDIGIPKNIIENKELQHEIIDDEIIKLLPKREVISHKGSYGKILIIAGSKNMIGALLLSSLAAYKTGSGLVYALTEKGNEQVVFSQVPEAIVHTYNKDEVTFISQIERLEYLINSVDAILVGPGLSCDRYATKLVKKAMESQKPLIVDADGLNILSLNKEWLQNRNELAILTPHIGEMSRLTGAKGKEILRNMKEYTMDFSKENGVITVLKSAKTVIAFENYLAVNPFGNSGMATAGSGDVLAGIIVSLLGQGVSSFLAAKLGVYIHSKAEDMAKVRCSERSMIARDIIVEIQNVLR